jgi:peptidoglycan/LPS O-acetylase OafA/YrhL
LTNGEPDVASAAPPAAASDISDPPPFAATRRLPGIEGLRAIAASSIVVLHVWQFSSPQALHSPNVVARGLYTLTAGVTLFFTLSGFLLFRPFAAAIARSRPLPSFRAYLRNRALRILPAYWVILAVTSLVLGVAAIRDKSGALSTGRLSDPFKLIETALFVNGYRPRTLEIGILPAWSLAVEVVFYLTLPLLVLCAYGLARRATTRRGRTLMLLAAPAAILAIGLVGKALAAYVVPGPPLAGWTQTWHAVIERGFLGQADLFAFGMILAVVYVAFLDSGRYLSAKGRWALGVSGLGAFAVCARVLPVGAGQSYLLENTAEAAAIAVLLAVIVLPSPPHEQRRITLRVLESRLLVAIGLGSYSLFLWHEPVIDWLRSHGVMVDGWGGLLLNLGVVVVVLAPVCYLTYRFVEAPALRRKRRVAEPGVLTAPLPVTAGASDGGPLAQLSAAYRTTGEQ